MLFANSMRNIFMQRSLISVSLSVTTLKYFSGSAKTISCRTGHGLFLASLFSSIHHKNHNQCFKINCCSPSDPHKGLFQVVWRCLLPERLGPMSSRQNLEYTFQMRSGFIHYCHDVLGNGSTYPMSTTGKPWNQR